MKKRKIPPNQGFIIHKGQNVRAKYRQGEIPDFEGNPLIEALPTLWETWQVMKRLNNQPEFKEADRKLSNRNRLILIQTALRFFVPLDVHLDLEQRITSVIRLGYLSRNPFSKEYWKKINSKIETFDQYQDQYESDNEDPSWTASGFTIVGMSGVGKSRSILKILNLYPQIIHPAKYLDKNFTHEQIVWLKIECPHDGSRRGLCKAFLRSVDAIIGTTYYIDYSKGNPTIDDLLDALATVAANHFLGVLVIDEIQRLSFAKSGGDKLMLNFFVQLINTIGIPVILVGTYKALSVLSGEFSQIRRGTGQGDMVWHRMEKDEQWNLFIETMWKYQYTRNEVELTQKLKDVLYEESQGITDFAVKIFGFAQKRAIESELEKISVGIIRSAAKDYLNIPRPILNALKTGDTRILENYEDIYPHVIDEAFTLLTLESDQSEIENSEPKQPLSEKDDNQTTKQNASVKEAKDTDSGIQGSKRTGKKSNKYKTTEYGLSPAKLPKTTSSIKKRGLLNFTPNIKNQDASVMYESLNKAGYMRSVNEFHSQTI